MQCQVKTMHFLALLIIISNFFGQKVYSGELNWQNLSNPKTIDSINNHVGRKIEIEPYSSAQGEIISSYFPFFKEVGRFIWGWEPRDSWDDKTKDSRPELKNTSNEIGDAIFREPPTSGLQELMKSLFVEFEVSNTNNFRKVWFNPTPELRFRGLLGIHDFNKKRPFIILRMGIHGNVDELVAERFLAKLVYEDLDANFLLLESLTSHAFLSKNKNISFGGVDEGLQTFFVLNEIKKSKLSEIINTWHLLSISMGSHGTFVTALLDQYNGHKINSILNFCPLIDLQQTFEHGLKTNLKNAMIDLWNSRRLKAVESIYHQETGFHEWWKTIFDFRPRYTSTLLKMLNSERKQPLISIHQLEELVPGLQWPVGFKSHLEHANSFFELNNFWSHYQGVKTPVMIYLTPNDPVVPNELNAERIFRNKQAGDFTSLKYHRLERGIHCGLPPVYQWNYIVKLVREGLEL